MPRHHGCLCAKDILLDPPLERATVEGMPGTHPMIDLFTKHSREIGGIRIMTKHVTIDNVMDWISPPIEEQRSDIRRPC